ncbi:MAG: DNA/RNA nuclease SfsA [Pseudomonadales bacterium]|nr:DNA/RNA nuclease SfsA [Pseudomonadales bacterium]
MKFEPVLQCGILLRRYKRFLADVELPDGSVLTMHCPNTGAMAGCSEPGSQVWFSESSNTKRKYPNTLELVKNAEGHMIGVNSALANRIVEEWLILGLIKPLLDYSVIRREARIPESNGRFDFMLSASDSSLPVCYVEVKSMTLNAGRGLGIFPDAVSDRAKRHVQALEWCVQEGYRGVLLFCVQHSGIDRAAIAGEIDPSYAQALELAKQSGVEVLAYAASMDITGIGFSRQLEFID